jgi:hypothetical protein
MPPERDAFGPEGCHLVFHVKHWPAQNLLACLRIGITGGICLNGSLRTSGGGILGFCTAPPLLPKGTTSLIDLGSGAGVPDSCLRSC